MPIKNEISAAAAFLMVAVLVIGAMGSMGWLFYGIGYMEALSDVSSSGCEAWLDRG